MATGTDAGIDGLIFILGLQRGGTNQVFNVLRSHPDCAWPDGELHQVLRPSSDMISARPARVARRLPGYLSLALRSGGDVLNPRRPPGRDALGEAGRDWVLAGLADAVRANAPVVRRHHAEMAEHGMHMRAATATRMLVKLMNYNVAFAADLAAGAPSTRLVAITRDPIGTCESLTSRGMPLEKATALWRDVGTTLANLRDAGGPILILHLEAFVADLPGKVREIYDFCGLDPEAVRGLRLQDKKRRFGPDGEIEGMDKVDAFYDFERAAAHGRLDVNASAHRRMPAEDKARILEACGPAMMRLGYDPEVPSGLGAADG